MLSEDDRFLDFERLKSDRRIGRDAEEGRAVAMDGYGTKHPFHIPRAVESDHPQETTPSAVRKVIRDQPQFLDRSTRYTTQAVTLIDVAHMDHGILAGWIDLVENHGRPNGRA